MMGAIGGEIFRSRYFKNWSSETQTLCKTVTQQVNQSFINVLQERAANQVNASISENQIHLLSKWEFDGLFSKRVQTTSANNE